MLCLALGWISVILVLVLVLRGVYGLDGSEREDKK
jgi:uncharacterized membrane protein